MRMLQARPFREVLDGGVCCVSLRFMPGLISGGNILYDSTHVLGCWPNDIAR